MILHLSSDGQAVKTQNALIRKPKRGRRPTLLREGLLEDALVEAAEGSAEILEVSEAQLLVPRLRDRQAVLGLRWGRGRRQRRGGLLEAQGLGRRLRVAIHLQDREEGGKTKDEKQ